MKSIVVRIIDKKWLNVKFIKKISVLANKYRADIMFNYDGHLANAKSIISLMSVCGQIKKLPATIEIFAKGWNDSHDALKSIVASMRATTFVL